MGNLKPLKFQELESIAVNKSIDGNPSPPAVTLSGRVANIFVDIQLQKSVFYTESQQKSHNDEASLEKLKMIISDS